MLGEEQNESATLAVVVQHVVTHALSNIALETGSVALQIFCVAGSVANLSGLLWLAPKAQQ